MKYYTAVFSIYILLNGFCLIPSSIDVEFCTDFFEINMLDNAKNILGYTK